MQIYISCSKTMTESPKLKVSSSQYPEFLSEAKKIARDMAQYSVAELQNILKVNFKLAQQTRQRYIDIASYSNPLPAISTYTGTAFRALNAATFKAEDIEYCNEHLTIGSFLYGLLRPLDLIMPYRLEGSVETSSTNLEPLFDYWRPIITDTFIKRIKDDDGILINLASQELQKILDWQKVEKEVNVISPQFKVMYDVKPVTVAMYAKMCRGAMTRQIILNRITEPEELTNFNFNGFTYWKDMTFVLNP